MSDDRDGGHRSDQMRSIMDFEERAREMLSSVFGGVHHITGWNTRRRYGAGLAVIVVQNLATFDGDLLTRLVVEGHDRCIRVEVNPFGKGMLQVVLHPRARTGRNLWERHPTIEDAVTRIRAGRAPDLYTSTLMLEED